MSKKFPNKIYVLDLNDVDEDESDLIIKETEEDIFDCCIDDDKVAVYQLVKKGKVKESKKIVFE